jgi:hypothetical protein
MTTQQLSRRNELRHAPADFSFVLGGPLFQLLRRAHLSDDALSLTHRRLMFISLFCWFPLLVISALEGQAFGGNVAVPFMRDLEAHVRFLVVTPLLIVSELVVHQRMRFVVEQFLERNLIAADDMPRFDAAIASAFRLRDSVLAEIVLIAFVFVVGILVIWRYYIALDTSTWYALSTAEGRTASFAGMWFGYVSLPIFQFLLLRWYFRIFIWGRFLWQVSQIDLQLVPTHPDRAGGLGFLSNTVYAFIPLLLAHGALLAAWISGRIFHLRGSLLDFKIEILTLVVFLLCLVQGPLLVFAPQLAQAKRTGSRAFGAFAERYARAFNEKWLEHGVQPDDHLLGSADIQSLADLDNSHDVVRGMRISLLSKQAILQLSAAVVAPILPLGLTLVPLDELLTRLLGMLF